MNVCVHRTQVTRVHITPCNSKINAKFTARKLNLIIERWHDTEGREKELDFKSIYMYESSGAMHRKEVC